jgi:hypothetical protein
MGRVDGRDGGREPSAMIGALLLAMAILTAACGQGEERRPLAGAISPAADHRAVGFSSGGVRLEGTLYGEGDVGVVLAGGKGGQFQWGREFPRALAEAGFMVLAYNWRGVCPQGPDDPLYGCSEGTVDATVSNTCGVSPAESTIPSDIVAAVAFVRSQGARDVFLIGEGHIGGNGSLFVASGWPGVASPRDGISGIVSIGGGTPCEVYGLMAVPKRAFRQIAVPVLFIDAKPGRSGSEQLAPAPPTGPTVEQFHAWTRAPKQLLLVREAGVGVLFGDQREEVLEAVVDFVVQTGQG